MNCIICNKLLTGKQKKFCSRTCHNQNGNYLHQSYQSQQKRGLERKIKLVKLLGGECHICGYCKNLAALQFHHTNPNQKDDNLDMRKLSNSTWKWCLGEANKCQLLCANCHSETHHPHLTFSNGAL
jgi:hypothetical protein